MCCYGSMPEVGIHSDFTALFIPVTVNASLAHHNKQTCETDSCVYHKGQFKTDVDVCPSFFLNAS